MAVAVPIDGADRPGHRAGAVPGRDHHDLRHKGRGDAVSADTERPREGLHEPDQEPAAERSAR